MGVARVYTGVEDARYLPIYLLRRARRKRSFDPPKLGDRQHTGELMRGSFIPHSHIAAVAVTT